MGNTNTTPPGNWVIANSLIFAVFLWGGNNAGVKYLVGAWPPVFIGCTRFILAGLLLLGLLHGTSLMGTPMPLTPAVRKNLWWRTGLSLAVYIVSFNWALHFTAASHVALYLGASPVWALLLEGNHSRSWHSVRQFACALLAFSGVLLLLWPALMQQNSQWPGEVLALTASFLWAFHGRQCRYMGKALSGAAITAHTMWRAGLWLAPLSAWEIIGKLPEWQWSRAGVQAYCIVAGGVAAFGLWNNALCHWPASRVYLFNNLIPLSTASWSALCLGESLSPTFLAAMALILGAVFLAQSNFRKLTP